MTINEMIRLGIIDIIRIIEAPGRIDSNMLPTQKTMIKPMTSPMTCMIIAAILDQGII